MGILKNPQIIIKSDDAKSIANDMLEDIMNGSWVDMENINSPLEVEVLPGTTIEKALTNIDLSTVRVQYRYNTSSIPILAEGTLSLYSDASTTLRTGYYYPLFKFIPTNPELYASKAEYYLMDDIVKISIKPSKEEKEES